MENGWQTRQERKANTTHHRLIRLLRKNFQASLGKEENLNSNISSNFFLIFSHKEMLKLVFIGSGVKRLVKEK